MKKKSKKGQLKIQEMAFMLVAVVLFFGLVMLFVLTVVYSNMYNQMNIINQEKTLTSLINLADSPEFRCVTTKSNCVDGDKVISLMNRSFYSNFWQFSSLSIIKSSAFAKNESEMIKCNWANYPDCDLIVIYDDIDLPIGKIKISFDRSSGGHNGVGSIIKHLKSQESLPLP